MPVVQTGTLVKFELIEAIHGSPSMFHRQRQVEQHRVRNESCWFVANTKQQLHNRLYGSQVVEAVIGITFLALIDRSFYNQACIEAKVIQVTRAVAMGLNTARPIKPF
jgi:hypothetical protein